jgi:alkylation response protein AidB-like acyl-CoA dehydrogenase
MTTTTIRATDEVLTDDMLARFEDRAAGYDRENRFFHEDFAELQGSGYLRISVPQKFGGPGLRLTEVLALQRRLAYVAPATALGVNMHLYWTGVAAELHRAGDPSCDWMLERAAAGAVFAAGHGEAGNDMPLFYSSARAEQVDGGWRISGHKIFGTLTPVWTFLGLHAMDASDPANRRIVHAFVPRDAEHYRIEETWDVLGMRATQSQDTILERAFVPDEYVPIVCPAGLKGAGLFHLSAFAWGLLGIGAVYSSIARRAYDLTVENLPRRASVFLTRSMAHHPEAQHLVAEMRMALEATDAFVDRVAKDWTDGVDHGMNWPVKIVSAKHFAVTQAFRVVDLALDLSGGAGIFARNQLERLFRDCRLGRIHPANEMLTHELVGKFSLGIDLDDPQRWG